MLATAPELPDESLRREQAEPTLASSRTTLQRMAQSTLQRMAQSLRGVRGPVNFRDLMAENHPPADEQERGRGEADARGDSAPAAASGPAQSAPRTTGTATTAASAASMNEGFDDDE